MYQQPTCTAEDVRPVVSCSPKSSASALAQDQNPVNLEQLARRCMGRIELAERLLKSFETRFPDDLAKVEDCLAKDDSTALARLVHQLKGSAANISAPELYAILTRMEQAVRGQQPAVAHDCLLEINQAWHRFLQFTSSSTER